MPCFNDEKEYITMHAIDYSQELMEGKLSLDKHTSRITQLQKEINATENAIFHSLKREKQLGQLLSQ